MAKTRAVEDKPSTSQKSIKTRKKTQQTRTAKRVTKPTKSRGSCNSLNAAKKVAEKPKGARDRTHKLRNEEGMEVRTTGHMQAAFKAEKTSREQEEAPMMLTDANETRTATTTTSSTAEFQAIITRDLRKSQRIETCAKASLTDSNIANVIDVPRPKAKFSPTEKKETVGTILADLGNWTTILGRILGFDEPEIFDSWKGVTVQRHSEIRTRVVAKWEDGKWCLVFGPETNLACDTEGKMVVFDNLKLSMNPKSEQFQLRREKEKRIGIENIFHKYIEWVFRTVFDASKQVNENITSFLVYTALPPDWPEEVSFEYYEIITNIPGWEGRVKVSIISEPTAAIIGRLKSLKVEQRKSLGVYLEDLEHAAILDLGDATANVGVVYSESYQPVAAATELFGFGILNRIVEDILGPSKWLNEEFGDACREYLQQWMQTDFLVTYKPKLGGGQQHTLEVKNRKVPDELANQIEEAVLEHFDKVIDFALNFFNTWSGNTGIKLKWIATSGGGSASMPFQARFNIRAGPYTVFHNPEYACGEDVLDGLKQQPHLRSTIEKFPCNYGLGQDLDNVSVGDNDRPQHVLVFAEKNDRVPKVIRSIPYYIPEPQDGKWEINLTILKSYQNLSTVGLEEGLNHKVVSIDGWTELPARNIEIPFDNSIKDFGIQHFDDEGRITHSEACVYLLLEFQGIQFDVHAMGRLDGKEDVSFRNLQTSKRQGYEVHGFNDRRKYFHVTTSTPTRVLEGTQVDPIDLD